jgi:hypothetical protein
VYGRAVVVFEYNDHVEVAQTKLHTFEMYDFDLGEGETGERGSVSWTRQSVVGCTRTEERDGTPLKPSSRYGISIDTFSFRAASAIFSAKFLISLSRAARRLRSSCSCSNSSSSPNLWRRLRLPVSSNCISVASRTNLTSLVFFLPSMMGFLRCT